MFLLRVGEYVFLCVCTWSYLYILCTDVRGGFFAGENVMYTYRIIFVAGRF